MPDYSDAYLVVKAIITVERDNDNKKQNRKLIFQNNAPFRSYISKINNMFVNNTEDFDIVLPMYNLLEYCDKLFYGIKKFVELLQRWNKWIDKLLEDRSHTNVQDSECISSVKATTVKVSNKFLSTKLLNNAKISLASIVYDCMDTFCTWLDKAKKI